MRSVIIRIAACLSAALAICSCQNRYRIEGTTSVYGHEGGTMQLVYFEDRTLHPLDSCVVNHGRFYMENRVDGPKYALIMKDDKAVLPLIVEGGKTRIEISPDGATVSGTRQNEILYSFLNEKAVVDHRFDEMNQKKRQLACQQPVDVEALSATRDSLRVIISEWEGLIMDFFRTNWDQNASLGVFMMLTYNLHDNLPPVIRKILDEAPEEFMQDPYVLDVTGRVNYSKPAVQ